MIKASPFRCNFNLFDYKDILPPVPQAEEMLNSDKPIEEQYWTKQRYPDIITPEYLYQEGVRIKQGVWMYNKGVPLWIPGNYYFFLQYGSTGGDDPQFRLKRLKRVYEKIRVRRNKQFIGTYIIKNRQDGDTTMSMSDLLWEIISGDLTSGMCGIQSKTNEDAYLPCWVTLKAHWIGYPQFIKDAFYSHFISGDNIERQMQFSKEADKNDTNARSQFVLIKYFPAVHNAMDGKNNVRRCVLDEINKWAVAKFDVTFKNYEKFIKPGKIRKGIFDIISSPADVDGRHNDVAKKFWDAANINIIDPETGATKNRIYRIYSCPLDGIEGFYDKYGDCDPQEILEHVHRERKNTDKELLMAEVRGNPLPIHGTFEPNEEELFGATDNGDTKIFFNISGIKNQSAIVKADKANKIEFGNLSWPMGVEFSGMPVWEPSGKLEFNDTDSKFCRTFPNIPRIETPDIFSPPKESLVQGVLGVDPFLNAFHTKDKNRQSLGAVVGWMFRDFSEYGKIEIPTFGYYARPMSDTEFHDDMVKLCVFTGYFMQYECSDGDQLLKHFLKHNMERWLLDSEDKKRVQTPYGEVVRKGDKPTGRGAKEFTQNLIILINGATKLPYNSDELYTLPDFNIPEVLDDLANFKYENTQYSHFTMALGQALKGRGKLLVRRKKPKDNKYNEALKMVIG